MYNKLLNLAEDSNYSSHGQWAVGGVVARLTPSVPRSEKGACFGGHSSMDNVERKTLTFVDAFPKSENPTKAKTGQGLVEDSKQIMGDGANTSKSLAELSEREKNTRTPKTFCQVGKRQACR